MPKQTPKPEPAFEEALAELEALVDQLERGDLSLEDSLKSFERGVALTALCQRALAAAGNPESFVEELQRAGYATDPGYAAKLKNIMGGEDLALVRAELKGAPTRPI